MESLAREDSDVKENLMQIRMSALFPMHMLVSYIQLVQMCVILADFVDV